MKRIWLLPVAIAAAGVLTSASSGQAPNAHGLVRAGALHVTKECSQFDGTVGSFCTITGSNISVIRPGMRVVYLAPVAKDGSLDSDLVLTGGGHQTAAVGHVVLNDTTMRVTIWGGSGAFACFHADVTVSQDKAGIWHWDGTYHFGVCLDLERGTG